MSFRPHWYRDEHRPGCTCASCSGRRPKRLYRPRVTVVITNSEGNVLLVKHNRERSWSLPGGRIKPGEDPKAAGLREVFEETSLHLKNAQYVGRYEGKGTPHIVFSGESSKQPRINLREIQSAVWWNRTSILDLNPHVDGILKLVDQSEERTQKEATTLTTFIGTSEESATPKEGHRPEESRWDSDHPVHCRCEKCTKPGPDQASTSNQPPPPRRPRGRSEGYPSRRSGFPFGKVILSIVVLAAVLGGVFALGDRYGSALLEYLEDPSPQEVVVVVVTATPTGTSTLEPPTATVTPEPTLTPTSTPTKTEIQFSRGRVEWYQGTVVPTAEHVPTHTPTATPTITPTPLPTATGTPTPIPTPAPTSTPKPTATPTSTPTPVPTATPVPRANLRHMDEKLYMLELINAERAKAGVPPVVLGDNIAAQLHAEASLAGCYSSHWDSDGLKPYMRYSLAGGYQSNGENGLGLDFCITSQTRSPQGHHYTSLDPIKKEIKDAMDIWMSSEGHRNNILGKYHKRVNIGLAWDQYNLMAYQHFEGDYVLYDQLPSINGNVLQLSGKVSEEVQLSNDLGVQVFYDQPPHSLTRGQLSRTYCYDSGRLVASLRAPLLGGWLYDSHEFTWSHKSCASPYEIPANAPAPQSPDQAHRFWQETYMKSLSLVEQLITVPWITANEWRIYRDSFTVSANLEDPLNQFGEGVYTIVVWGTIDGEDAVISEYSVFHGVTAPATYISPTGK